MTNLQRAKRIKRELGLDLTDREVEKIISSIISGLKEELMTTGKTSIRGIGKLKIKEIKPRVHKLHGKEYSTKYPIKISMETSKVLLKELSEK